MYQNNEYLKKNDIDFSENGGDHVKWKFSTILPLLDKFMLAVAKSHINVLDVGGGAGHILKMTTEYLQNKNDVKIRMFTCDLSPGFLQMQIKNNPGLVKALNEDIRNTTLGAKEIDLTLMIDVLEHVPEYELALTELKRISQYVILIVPLEDNVMLRLYNRLTNNKQRKWSIETLGHINQFHAARIKNKVNSVLGTIIESYYANTFDHYRRTGYYNNKSRLKKIVNEMAYLTHKMSPHLSSRLFFDSIVMLVKCNHTNNH